MLELKNIVNLLFMTQNLISVSRLDKLDFAFLFKNGLHKLNYESNTIGIGTLCDALTD